MQIETLVARYDDGASMKSLAAEFTLHRTTVASLLRAKGVRLRRQGLSEQDLTLAGQLYQDGWSLSRLGEKFGCTAETVRQTFLRAGVERKRPWER